MTQQPAESLSDSASRLLENGGIVVTYYESPEPGGPRQLYPARFFCLTLTREAARACADAMDQLVLAAYAHVIARLGGTGRPEIIRHRRGEPAGPAELEPCLERLVAHGYQRQCASGHALTPADEVAVAALDKAHPAHPARFRVIESSGTYRRTRDEARDLARRRRQDVLTPAEEVWP
jgi:hypothetical protein